MIEMAKHGRLAGRRAIVTGGSRGIGAAIVEAFVREGAAVAFCHLGDDEGAKQTIERARMIGAPPFASECDVSDPKAIASFVTLVEAAHGPTDILVNNAGISISRRFEDISLEEYDKIVGIHLRGTFMMTQAVYTGMKARRFGRIINISSQLAIKGGVDHAHYCAAKAGVLGLTRALAAEGAPFGVMVNAIAPGPVETAMLAAPSQEWKARKLAELPIGRFGMTHEIAPAAVFLASDDSTYIVGATLHVNGGDVMA
jgi:3-oxoacyl-[acyl-carrier protein] reductase